MTNDDPLKCHRGTHVELWGGPSWRQLLFSSGCSAESQILCDVAWLLNHASEKTLANLSQFIQNAKRDLNEAVQEAK